MRISRARSSASTTRRTGSSTRRRRPRSHRAVRPRARAHARDRRPARSTSTGWTTWRSHARTSRSRRRSAWSRAAPTTSRPGDPPVPQPDDGGDPGRWGHQRRAADDHELQAYPYTDGQRFVDAIADEGGTDAVDEALRSFPTTTEQVLHPAKYPDEQPQDLDVPDFAPTFGEDWEDLDVMVVGALAEGPAGVAARGGVRVHGRGRLGRRSTGRGATATTSPSRWSRRGTRRRRRARSPMRSAAGCGTATAAVSCSTPTATGSSPVRVQRGSDRSARGRAPDDLT